MEHKKSHPISSSLIKHRAAYLEQKCNQEAMENSNTDAGIQNPNNVVDNPYEAKAIFGNDGPANNAIKAKVRLKSHIGPVDTEAELIELQLNKPRP